MFRVVNAKEAQSPYAQRVRARLAQSSDVRVLVQTARYLLAWGNPFGQGGRDKGIAAIQLARTYVDRALSIEPDSELARLAMARTGSYSPSVCAAD